MTTSPSHKEQVLTIFKAYGRPQEGNTIPTSAAPTYLTNCARAPNAINYYQRTNGSERTPMIPY
jgi:ribonuclease T2